MTETDARPQMRRVAANLVEASPNPAGQWLLASPLIVYMGWLWLDIFNYYSPVPWRWLDMILGAVVYLLLIILPLGLLAHRLITSLPRLFQNAGWDVVPLEPVRESEQYMVKYVAQEKAYAPFTQARVWQRAAQGWVYIEIFAILAGALLLIPIFLSATRFGFGS
jgi:hypothetical protein